ncbi:MAG TPA: hypothetical protein VF432_33675 [Thermoanaerobaculia bacterium]
MMRRVAAGLLLAALFAGGVRLSILRLLLPPHRPPETPAPPGAIDRKPLRFANDPVETGVLQFLGRVRADTRPGERIALMMAPPHGGWTYTHWRASYELSGRHVMPPVQWETMPDVVALWRTGWGDPQYELVWSDADSALLRRKP